MLDFVWETESDTVVTEGVTVLDYRLEYPLFSGKRAARAQREVAKMLSDTRALIEALSSRGIREYAESTDPHRRFRFAPYRLTLLYLSTCADARYLSFAIRLALYKGARALRTVTFGESYRRADGSPLAVGCFRSAREVRAHGTAFSILAEDEVRFWTQEAAKPKSNMR